LFGPGVNPIASENKRAAMNVSNDMMRGDTGLGHFRNGPSHERRAWLVREGGLS
jgi:hypothetical protein